MKTQIASMKRVAQLGFEIMFCSHNPQFKQAKEKLKRKIQFMEDYYGKVKQLHKQGLKPKAIMKSLDLRENWSIRILSGGALSGLNMVKSVIRDEEDRKG